MTGTVGHTTGISTTAWVKLSPAAADVPEDPTHAKLIANTALCGKAENELNGTTEIGDIAKEANTIEYNEYGKDTTSTIAGQSSLGAFEITFAIDRADALHTALIAAKNGTKVAVGLKTTKGAGETVDLIQGEVAGFTQSRPIDDVASGTLSIALSENLQSFDKA